METSLRELLQHKGSEVYHIEPGATVMAASLMMRKRKVGALLVIREKEIVGILTERDILNRLVAEGANADDVKVEEIMTAEVIAIGPSRSIRDAMQVVTEKRLRHLPVVEEGRIVGMLSGGDLTRSIVAEEEGFIHTLYEYIYGSNPV
jgi:CBS domain-containing protein